MPEGPEGATVRDELKSTIVGKSITNFIINSSYKIIDVHKLSVPNKITTVESYGKKVLIYCQNIIIIFSLGMTGRFMYQSTKHSKILFDFDDGRQLSFEDSRGFGNVEMTDTLEPLFNKLGPDLLAHAMSESTWIAKYKWMSLFKAQKYANWKICKALQDQGIVSGIGNYLSSEILYYSGIHPERTLNTITNDEWERLRVSAHKIILLSYKHGGLTINSYIAPNGNLGTYPAAVYNKKEDPYGNPVVYKKVNGRGTYFVLQFQH